MISIKEIKNTTEKWEFTENPMIKSDLKEKKTKENPIPKSWNNKGEKKKVTIYENHTNTNHKYISNL